jgi:hypothetical protein
LSKKPRPGSEGSQMNNLIPLLLLSGITDSTARVDVILSLVETSAEPHAEQIASIVQSFALAGARGGFAEVGTRPDQSNVNLLSDIEFEPGKVSFKLAVEHIHFGAFQTLRNMLGNISHAQPFIRRIIVSDAESKGVAPITAAEITDENQDDLYPPISSQVAIYIDWGSAGSSKVRRFLVEFSQPPDALEVAALSDWIRPWCVMLEVAAFALPFDVQESDSFVGTVTQFDEVTLELVIDRFMASEAAWNVLINMIGSYALKHSRVSKVSID